MQSVANAPQKPGLAGGSSAKGGSGHAVDVANFFLIWITLGFALAWPFQLFLFSYIVLGPIHYLTEINWLNKQNYFLRTKDTRIFVWGMIILVLLLTVAVILPETNSWAWTKPIFSSIYKSPGSPLPQVLKWTWTLLLLAFVAAAAWLFTGQMFLRLVVVAFCLVSSLFFYTVPTVAILFGILLPTIGHVFLFTIMFMLYGTLKMRSTWGYVNIISMFVVVGVIVAWPYHVEYTSLGRSVNELDNASAFQQVNFAIRKWLGLTQPGNVDYYSPAVSKVQSFIAFAYTYHYLNWFSKTSIIKWHHVEKQKFVLSAVLWVASVALYLVDYRLGFAAASALSLLHIVLEFPLNFVSMRSIWNVLWVKPKTVQV